MRGDYQICTRCIMDTTDPYIVFDENGVCHHCTRYYERVRTHVFAGDEGEQRLCAIVDRIKRQGKNKEYDCMMGLSGGTDSTYVAYLAKQLGLRVLVVNVDNGWDPEITVENVRNVPNKLGFDMHTCVLDWNEFKDVQLAHFKASVINIEAITDHAIRAALYNIANERGIKYVLSGSNIVTEGIMPMSWGFNNNDLMNLRDIHHQFGTVELKTFPTFGLRKLLYYQYLKRIEFVPILNYMPYVKKHVKELLARELDWKDYGSKHHESIFTRFYQAYILPTKFNIDKRKAHLSCLICAGQITREDALKEMEEEPYPEAELRRDKAYVLRKLGLTDEEFEGLMNLPIRSHLDFKSDFRWLQLVWFVRRGAGLIRGMLRWAVGFTERS